ncbi:hypothetical protein DFJ73DRAFT_771837 [Zopfochytrium polystomum]|nr:hypothetical protein DFJ73DRAFT_771837 [Zopfochytrium polystomum]
MSCCDDAVFDSLRTPFITIRQGAPVKTNNRTWGWQSLARRSQVRRPMRGSTVEGVAAVVSDHQALAGAAGEELRHHDTRPSRHRQHHRLFATTGEPPPPPSTTRILVIVVIAVRVPGQLSHTCTLAPPNKGAYT